MQRPNREIQKRIRECENPTFGYRRGGDGEIEKDIFDGEPLPAGWVDSPAMVDEVRAAVTTTLPVSLVVVPIPVPPPEGGSGPSYEDRKFHDLRAELIRRGKKWDRGDNKAAVIGRLKNLDASK